VASAQVKSAIMLAGLYTGDSIRVYQPGPSRDHTERLLMAMGMVINVNDGWVIMSDAPPGGRRLLPLDMTVPGDFSSAAFPLVAAAVIPGSQITIRQVGVNPTRTGLLDLLGTMGARITVANQQVTGGELIADIVVTYSGLNAIEVGGPTVVRAIDEFPVWAVAATQATGASTLHEAAELRVKEVDRIAVLAEELRRFGALVDEYDDGFTVQGARHLKGIGVDSHDDHRLGMALVVAGLVADGATIVHDSACISDSFPGFVETMQQLGASVEHVEAG
jgi:3-phosphoshikimate 1-carboxyvinyltransferase